MYDLFIKEFENILIKDGYLASDIIINQQNTEAICKLCPSIIHFKCHKKMQQFTCI